MEDERDAIRRPRGRTLLTPRDVRRKRFNPTRLGRRGFAPGEVREFLGLVEVDLTVLYQELASAREEAAMMKTALRDWQRQHGVCYVRGSQDKHEIYRRPAVPEPRERRGD